MDDLPTSDSCELQPEAAGAAVADQLRQVTNGKFFNFDASSPTAFDELGLKPLIPERVYHVQVGEQYWRPVPQFEVKEFATVAVNGADVARRMKGLDTAYRALQNLFMGQLRKDPPRMWAHAFKEASKMAYNLQYSACAFRRFTVLTAGSTHMRLWCTRACEFCLRVCEDLSRSLTFLPRGCVAVFRENVGKAKQKFNEALDACGTTKGTFGSERDMFERLLKSALATYGPTGLIDQEVLAGLDFTNDQELLIRTVERGTLNRPNEQLLIIREV